MACDKDAKHHLKPIQQATPAKTTKAAIAAIMRPRISSASPISNLATFRIFLFKCHDFFFFFPPGLTKRLCASGFGEIALCGSTWGAVSLRPQVESSGS